MVVVAGVEDLAVAVSLGFSQVSDAVEKVGLAFGHQAQALDRLGRAIRAAMRTRRSGHRHRGERAWIVRNVPSYKTPLGTRTQLKLWSVRINGGTRA